MLLEGFPFHQFNFFYANNSSVFVISTCYVVVKYNKFNKILMVFQVLILNNQAIVISKLEFSLLSEFNVQNHQI